jgi:hypothetical protein
MRRLGYDPTQIHQLITWTQHPPRTFRQASVQSLKIAFSKRLEIQIPRIALIPEAPQRARLQNLQMFEFARKQSTVDVKSNSDCESL